MKKLLIVGPLPKRIEGISVAFKYIKDWLNSNMIYDIVNTAQYNLNNKIGKFSTSRALETILIVIDYAKKIRSANNVYILIGVSFWGFVRDFVFIWLAKLFKVKITIHAHTGGYGIFYAQQNILIRYLIKMTLNKVDNIITLSKLLNQQFDFIDCKRKIIPISNGSPNIIPIKEIKKSYNGVRPLKLLYLSNMIKSKGYLECLHVAKKLKEINIKFKFNFCGAFVNHGLSSETAFELESEFKKYIKSNHLGEYVEYHGVVTGNQKHKLLCQADIFILPTFYEWEGQPISIIEALEYSLPVISSNHRAIPEMVVNNYNGCIVYNQNAIEIFNAIMFFIKNNTLIQEYSHNSYVQFLNNYTLKNHLSKIIPIITTKF